jgi:hypothetical protein
METSFDRPSATGRTASLPLCSAIGGEGPQRGGAFLGYDEKGEPVKVQLWGADIGTTRHDVLRRVQRSSLRFQEFALGNEQLVADMDRMRRNLTRESMT